MTQRTERVRSYQAGDVLPIITKTLTQGKVNRYAKVSGDGNPLHTDPVFAAGTQFGGTIAHGMLVLAYISELMTSVFGGQWSASGRLKIRFRGPARPDDTVTASGRVIRIEAGKISCEVECRNQNGEVLISGEASLRTR